MTHAWLIWRTDGPRADRGFLHRVTSGHRSRKPTRTARTPSAGVPPRRVRTEHIKRRNLLNDDRKCVGAASRISGSASGQRRSRRYPRERTSWVYVLQRDPCLLDRSDSAAAVGEGGCGPGALSMVLFWNTIIPSASSVATFDRFLSSTQDAETSIDGRPVPVQVVEAIELSRAGPHA